jgi:integrase
MTVWTSAGKGIRYREHPTRKHGKKPDRYWCIQYKLHGRNINEAVGWWSDGRTQSQCEELLSTLRINQKSGQGPQTLKEMREFNLDRRNAREAAAEAARDPKRTLAGYFEAEFLPYIRLNMKARTSASHVSVVRRRLAPLAGKPLSEVTASDLETLIIRPMLEEGLSPTYVEKALRVFSVIWNRAKSHGLAQGDNPVSKVKIPKKDGNRDRFLTKDEAIRLLAYLKKRYPDIHDVAVLSLFSGMRVGECLKLTWADVNLDDGSIFIKDSKNTRNRHAFMTSEIREVLTKRQAGKSKQLKVFPSANGGDGYSDLTMKFKIAVDDLKLNEGISDARQKVVFHTLRHTFASWQVQIGTPLYTVSQLMGHSGVKMTIRYAHLAPDSKRAAAMDLEGILGDKGCI